MRELVWLFYYLCYRDQWLTVIELLARNLQHLIVVLRWGQKVNNHEGNRGIMVELIVLTVFVVGLLVSGLTLMGFLVAAGAAAVTLLLISVLGLALKLLPWIIVIGLAVLAYRYYCRDSGADRWRR